MTTLQDQVTTAKLSAKCKQDLLYCVNGKNAEDARLPRKAATVADADLPTATAAFTVSRRNKSLPADVQTSTRQALTTQKAAQDQTMMDVAMEAAGESFTKKCNTTFRGEPTTEDPFRASRSRERLSGRDQDFVYRYAEAVTGEPIERDAPSTEAEIAATEAYIKAFRGYKGRDPTAKELHEVGRIAFAFDENGDIGVVQKPHTCHPHSHIASSNRRVADCPNQVYSPEMPPIRGARDRFPGPIPVWSSTKNTSTMVSNDTYVPGHIIQSSIKRDAANSLVGPKSK